MTYPNPQQPQPPATGGLTEEERTQRRNLHYFGIGLVAVVVVFSIVLSAIDAAVDPKFTAPVLSAMLIAAAASLGQAARIKRDAKRRG
ncbi:hypothetical protein [Glycomyces sp. NRRL B-16210]|uniref:hypothetical protein n=1 Tax=Glycomyces sp. NRRL B-16210 TaxID=1463821 RepID=UPI0004C11840|nr:hypothetical protein [Glycomyces sp. NRRL B-16210]